LSLRATSLAYFDVAGGTGLPTFNVSAGVTVDPPLQAP